MTTTEAQRLKTEGQQLSLGVLTEDDVAEFDRVIASYPVGRVLSSNTVRPQLDALSIPDSARGGLFHRAIARGLLARATVAGPDGVEYDRFERSSGRSAHNARVRVYVRTDPAGE
ncbi:hypothetical protein V2J56_09050 [Georgenia sp. MJ206]|uniref:hypothetical protein n=1 Tax=Georgenia wangjunii TaxID=3117730 RepID=UPI002F26B02D